MALNKTNTKISQAQFDILNLLLDNHHIVRLGQQPGYIEKKKNGIDTFVNNKFTCVKRNTLKVLIQKKLIEIETRYNWYKTYGISDKGWQLFLSLTN